MKNALLLLASAAAFSLGSCSSNSTSTTTTTGTPSDSTATTTTTSTASTGPMTDEAYHARGNRMADRFATKMKIKDAATREKLRQAYYERSKRYDALMAKYKADTTGFGAARRQYYADTDKEFQTILVVPEQYQAYQSSRPEYDEANNLDTSGQTAASSSATMPSDSSSSAMSSSTTTETTTTTTTDDNSMGSGAAVAKGKSKMTDGSKVKVKNDGTVKVKDAAGNKAKM
ncbi:hypothetical protein GKZ68_01825 [Hymenobacter sp. BRD128]|uniref:hypothetical protein n=1 Tax=Hymenobacter sp. BRD128 TaxID=2675878 RepID=UPI001566CA61|nr:hypothetical protein [Hymenobacter sp. BRD128]QKG55484.1 hypothetical protein GKZ68_01825 [Hymenobacter sp. BRD128]